LTPGTVSVDIQDHRILVHSLAGAGADEEEAGGEMDRRVTRLEGPL
jgi:multicomponent Na+:H+ antiporter subunit E